MAATKRVRNYVFTINNPNAFHHEMLEKLVADGIAGYILYQLEVGKETKTPHFQGQIELTNAMTISALQKQVGEFKFHFLQQMISKKGSTKYVTKSDTRIGGPWEIGTPKKQGARTDLEEISEMVKEKKSMKEIAEEYPSQYIRYNRGIKELKLALEEKKERVGWKPFLTIIKGQPGIGKSKMVFEKHFPNDEIYIKDPKIKWWDGYRGQDVVIINEFKSTSVISMEDFNNLIDYYPWRVETKGGTANFTSKFVYITTNYNPSEWWTGDMSSFWRRVDKYIDLDNSA